MSLRLEMLQAARLGPQLLGESAALVEAFLRGQQNPDGGFKDRTGQSDLYYTVFGLHGLLALQAPVAVEPVCKYLRGFGPGEGLDLVHLCCLARCWAALGEVRNLAKHAVAGEEKAGEESVRLSLENRCGEILARIEGHRSEDGGYNPNPNSSFGTLYGGFLAVGAYQDLNRPVPGTSRLAESVRTLATPDGAWANERGLKTGATNATAAAISILRYLEIPIPPAAGQWLLARAHPQGGFLAAPQVPLPDLLSTATALHALAGLGVSLTPLREPCLDFLDSLWTNAGAFHGHWADDHLDCEYTFYGLLSLGHLSWKNG